MIPRTFNDFISQSRHGRQKQISPPKATIQLREDKINTIIWYVGAFNMPHVGHLALLINGFNNSGDDLNIVAAIVNPRDDNFIELKAGNSNTVALPQKVRGNLWKEDDRFPDWACVFDGPDKQRRLFRKELRAAMNTRGYPVRIACLLGTDYFLPNFGNCDCGCDMMLYNDWSRRAEKHVWNGKIVKKFLEYSAWKTLKIRVSTKLRAQAKFFKNRSASRSVARITPRKPGGRKQVRNARGQFTSATRIAFECVSECTKNYYKVRFIPRNSRDPKSDRAISSTKIRAKLAAGVFVSKDLVLSPELLLRRWTEGLDAKRRMQEECVVA